MIYSKVSFLVLFYSHFTRLTFVLVHPSYVQTVHLGTYDNCYCGGLILSSSQAPTQLLTRPCPHSRMGDRRGKKKWEDFFNWWRKKKSKTTSRTSSFQPLNTLEAKKFLVLSLSLFLLLDIPQYDMQHPFSQFRPAVMTVSPPSCLLTSYLFAPGSRDRVEKREVFDALQALSSNSLNISVLWTLF